MVRSPQGTVAESPLLRLPEPPARTDMRLSPYPALHVSCPAVSLNRVYATILVNIETRRPVDGCGTPIGGTSGWTLKKPSAVIKDAAGAAVTI